MKFSLSFLGMLLLAALLGFPARQTCAQTLRILEAGSQQPVPFATLRSTDPQAIAQCDERGQVSLRDFRGAVQIDVRHMGYREKSVSFSELVAADYVLYLEPIVQAFETYVVSATRWRTRARAIPTKITQISLRTARCYSRRPPQTSWAVAVRSLSKKANRAAAVP
ncbi:peptidase associated/transthyretin-like domain-containing protein [Nitritalea halalkaliphila]|uniref:hypothetical protein n=1 Tax=Nitritalea halalkaliphila TaxID=590849 RepID=UPI00030573CC|nr:hypothetical protein [Nitritalea halalkaliphila]